MRKFTLTTLLLLSLFCTAGATDVTLPYNETLVSSQGQFTIENVSLGGLSAVWKTSQYGMTANGYQCTGNIESWFISPVIDARQVGSVNLTFDENVRYFANNSKVTEEATLWVCEADNGSWRQITLPAGVHANMSNNSFVNVGNIDLSVMGGKRFQIGFKFTATTTSPGRWEVKNLSVTGEGSVSTPVQVASVAEFNALDYNATFNFTGTNLVATVQKGNYLYAQDATGGMLIYGSIGKTYGMGDIIPAGFTATKGTFHAAAQAINITNMQAAVNHVDVTPQEFVAADLQAGSYSGLSGFGTYGVVRDVTVNGNSIELADGTSVATYDTFANVPATTSGKIYDVYGIIGWNNNEVQFLPTVYEETEVVTVSAPTITIEPEQETYYVGDEVKVTITTNESNVTIYYAVTEEPNVPAGNDYNTTLNGKSFTVTADKAKTMTVRAYVYKNDNNVSEIASKSIEFIEKPVIVTIPGDLNKDGMIDIVDVMVFTMFLRDELNPYNLGLEDVDLNGDVRVNVSDMVYWFNNCFNPFVVEHQSLYNEDAVSKVKATTTAQKILIQSDSDLELDHLQYVVKAGNFDSMGGLLFGEYYGSPITTNGVLVNNLKISTEVVEAGTLLELTDVRAYDRNGNLLKDGQGFHIYFENEITTETKPGDVNRDGDVNVSDVTTLINMILGTIPMDQSVADVNSDGAANVSDVTALINIILGMN